MNFGTIRCEELVAGLFEAFLGLGMVAGDGGDGCDDLKKENKEDDFLGGGGGEGGEVGSIGTGFLSCSTMAEGKRPEVETADSSVS